MFKGKKDKGGKAAGGRGDKPKPKHTGGIASMMGMDPGMDLGGDDDFEAELAKITGGTVKSGKGKKDSNQKKKQLTAADLDKIQKKLGADEDLDLDLGGSDGSDVSDSELLAELEELNLEVGDGDDGDDDKKSDGDDGDDSDIDAEFATLTEEVKSEKEQKKTKQAPPPPPPATATATARSANASAQQSPSVKQITDRITNYQGALKVAESEDAGSKIRRLKRGLTSLEEMLIQAKKGGAVNLDELPPPVATKAATKPAVTPAESDELARMASEMTDTSIAPESPSASNSDTDRIQSRLQLYQKAVQQCEDASKLRRYKRAMDTLQQMLGDSAASRPIDWDSLPPEISLTATKPPPSSTPQATVPPLISLEDDFEIPADEIQRLSQETTITTTRPAPPPPQPKPRPIRTAAPVRIAPEDTTSEKVREFLSERQSQYKQAAGAAKLAQNTDKARLYYKHALSFSGVIAALDEGAPVTLTGMPEAPEGFAPSFLLSVSVWPLKQTNAPKQEAAAPPSDESPSAPPEIDPSIPVPATLLEGLVQRLEKYKEGVAKSEQEGNTSKARRMKRILTQFQEAIAALKAGKPYDYNDLPAPPGYPPLPPPGARRPANTAPAPPAVTPRQLPTQPPVTSQEVRETEIPVGEEDDGPPSYAVSAPKTLLEGLQQRLVKYREGVEQAQKEDASSKVRRMSRLVKQYEEAITAAKRGATYDYEELPVPPGYPPLPLPGKGPAPVTAAVATKPTASRGPPAPQPQGASRGQLQRIDPDSYEEQLRVLNSRIDEFRGLAIGYRKENRLEEAKKYLLYMKGLEPMLELAKSGVRVDLTQVPPSTKPAASTAPVKRMTDLKKATGEDTELFSELEQSCNKQMDLCKTSAVQCRAIMDIGRANQFENLFEQCKRDLMNLKSARDHGYAPPAYHYEERQLPTFHINPSIEPDQCEVSVVHCINIPLPKDYESKDLDSYITFEFPFPSHEEPQTLSTRSVRGTTSPEYEDPKLFKIDRGKVKSFMRVCKRHPLKISIFYKKGMLRRGELIGNTSVNLSSLSNKAEIHESLVVMDGRKQTSCKLEVLIRLKEPLEVKEVIMQKHSWLVLDEFIVTNKTPLISAPKNLKQRQPATTTTATAATPQQSSSSATFLSPAKVDETPSIGALKLELQQTRDNQEAFKNKGKLVPAELSRREQAIVAKINHYQSNLTIPSFKKSYIAGLQAQIVKENEIASIYMQQSKRAEAEHYLKRKKQMSLEYESLVK